MTDTDGQEDHELQQFLHVDFDIGQEAAVSDPELQHVQVEVGQVEENGP